VQEAVAQVAVRLVVRAERCIPSERIIISRASSERILISMASSEGRLPEETLRLEETERGCVLELEHLRDARGQGTHAELLRHEEHEAHRAKRSREHRRELLRLVDADLRHSEAKRSHQIRLGDGPSKGIMGTQTQSSADQPATNSHLMREAIIMHSRQINQPPISQVRSPLMAVNQSPISQDRREPMRLIARVL
jgi:hypothetical protein